MTTSTSTSTHRNDRHGSAVVTLPSDTEILITRRFDAPAARVFEAWVTPDLVRRWWGSETSPLVVCDIDLRVGGQWRYVSREPDGTELGWHGTYREIDAPGRLVSTEVFEGFPDAESVNALTLTESSGVTTMRILVQHSSREHRDGHIQSGMEGGMQVTMDRLQDLLGGTATNVESPASSAASSTVADRYRRVAGRFTETVRSVPPGSWDAPAPCEGWVARDIVRHLVEWFPPFLASGTGIQIAPGPSVDADPVAAWLHVDRFVQALLDDPATAGVVLSHERAGTHPLDQAIGMFFLGDVLVHTWDLARSTGLDERLDPVEVSGMLAGLVPMDEVLRQSGHYGPRVEVPEGADEQTRLIAFVGRQP